MKYLENMRKNVKVKPGWWPLPFVRVLHSHHVEYAHHVSYMCTPYASNVGDVPEYVYPVHICEATRCLSHTWSGWDVFWEVHCITWLFSKKVWEMDISTLRNYKQTCIQLLHIIDICGSNLNFFLGPFHCHYLLLYWPMKGVRQVSSEFLQHLLTNGKSVIHIHFMWCNFTIHDICQVSLLDKIGFLCFFSSSHILFLSSASNLFLLLDSSLWCILVLSLPAGTSYALFSQWNSFPIHI